MSDYGFATYDDRTGRIAEKISYKYPIFGPEYRKISEQYKTIHITDTTQKSVKPQTLSNPHALDEWDFTYDVTYETSGGINYMKWFYNNQNYGFDSINGGTEKTEIYRYKHGFDKRPLGYYTITGELVINNRVSLNQKVNVNNTGVPVGGDFTLNTVATSSYRCIPRMNKFAFGGNTEVIESFPIEAIYTTKSTGLGSDYIRIPDACYNFFVSGEQSSLGVMSPCDYATDIAKNPTSVYYRYSVEIDDEWVKIYRLNYFNEYVARFKWDTRETIYRQQGSDWVLYSDTTNNLADVTQRVRMIDDYAGSNLDITVYLVPYNMEDLV